MAWDCATKTIYEGADQSCPYSNGCTMLRYGLGQGGTWRGTTYANWIDQVRDAS